MLKSLKIDLNKKIKEKFMKRQILPMSVNEFSNSSIEEVQKKFFLEDLKKRKTKNVNGKYVVSYQRYKNGIKNKNIEILFQYNNHIIACAYMTEDEKYKNSDKDGVRGEYHFLPNTIEVFSPISLDELRKIWPDDISRFSQAKKLLESDSKQEEKWKSLKERHRYLPEENEIYEENEKIFGELNKKKDLNETEKNTLIKSRLGHSKLKTYLYKKHKKCELCGMSLKELLRASHIKPWSKCETVEERLSLDNVLLLCPNHDVLFDLGFISFDPDGNILISENLNSENRIFNNVIEKFKIGMNKEKQKYMKWHREHIYKKY